MTKKYDRAWGEFWAKNANSGQGGGCLPAKWQVIDSAQKETWTHFAEGLAKSSRALDIATGDGRVMAWMLKRRQDLKLVGVDLAPALPPPPKGTKVRAGVAMEQLPFSDGTFDAIVSQFGFEYGDIIGAAREVARTLKAGGMLAIMTHRFDGPILEHNLKRREQINWALEVEDLITVAKRNLKLRASGVPASSPKLAAAPTEGARLHGEGSAAWEIAEAIRQTMVMGLRDHPANVAKTLDIIADQASNEKGRIASLEMACTKTRDEDSFVQALANGGLEQVSREAVCEAQTGRAFADFRVLRHSGV